MKSLESGDIMDTISKYGPYYYYNIIITERNLYDQAIDSDIKRYEKIRKLTTGQGGNYATGC